MKKLISTMVALAAILPLAFSPAFAGEKPTSGNGMGGGEISQSLLSGKTLCIGDKMLETCMNHNPLTREVNMRTVSRPRGLGVNTVNNRTIVVDEQATAKFDTFGRVIVSSSDIRGTENAAARWTSGFSNMPAAALNGLGASLVGALLNHCGDVCNSTIVVNDGSASAGAVADSFSGSTSTAVVQTATGACGTGNCPAGRQ